MDELYAHLNTYCAVTPDDFRHIQSFFQLRHVGKKEELYQAGRPNLHHFFVVRGCLQMYFITRRGVESTLQFAIENWWMTDYLAWQGGRSSEFSIQAVEDSVVLEINRESQSELLRAYPVLETYFRKVYEIAYGAAIMRVKFMMAYSKKEIFFYFREAHPEFTRKVPQQLLAGYLGLTPEYLSKLRQERDTPHAGDCPYPSPPNRR